MARIAIKPITLNKAYSGRRFATPYLKDFKQELMWQLPRMKIPDGKLACKYIFGVSFKGCDIDNLIKAFQDCLAEVYGFNDNRIYKLEVEKNDVKKGEEYIEFKIWSVI